MRYKLYKDNFDIEKNDGCLIFFIARFYILISFILIASIFDEWYKSVFFVFIAYLFWSFFLYEVILRNMPSWPLDKKFKGWLELNDENIFIDVETQKNIFDLREISELVFFMTSYKGCQIGLGIVDSGNALVFLKRKNEETAHFKFNIETENEYNHIKEMILKYKKEVEYVKSYGIHEISVILKPDYSDRIKYR